MTVQGEAPPPMRLTPQVVGWSRGFPFILAKILRPQARREAAPAATRLRGAIPDPARNGHGRSPEKLREISSFMISFVPP